MVESEGKLLIPFWQTQLRGVGNSLVHVAHYATSIMITQASPVGLAKIGEFLFFQHLATLLLTNLSQAGDTIASSAAPTS